MYIQQYTASTKLPLVVFFLVLLGLLFGGAQITLALRQFARFVTITGLLFVTITGLLFAFRKLRAAVNEKMEGKSK